MSEAPRALDEASMRRAAHELCARDRTLAAIVAQHGMPPLWQRDPGWRTLLHIILEQQVSLASARASLARLRRGIRPFTAARLARSEPAELRALGITRQKARYCVALARAVTERRFDAARLHRLDDAEICAALLELDGVGPWTAQCYLLLALRRPDIWPDGDLALRNAVAARFAVRSASRRAQIAARWRPWRSVAARILWHDYLQQRR